MTWISGREAADILSKNSGRRIKTDYLRSLAQKNMIRHRVNPADPTTKQYWKEELLTRRVRGRTETGKKTEEEKEDEHQAFQMAV